MSTATSQSTAATSSQQQQQEYLLLQNAQKSDADGLVKEAIDLYRQFILAESIDDVRTKEQSILRVSELIEDPQDLSIFIRSLQPIWSLFPRAKTAKIIRSILDTIPPTSVHLEVLLNELIAWCTQDRRFYLKQTLQIKLAEVYFKLSKYVESLELLSVLGKELRKLDDKLSLVQVHLLESQVYFAIKAMAKAKASLTAARTNGNAVYCPPLLLAQIDLQSGLLHADDGDFTTAFSYFIESLDGYVMAAHKDELLVDGSIPLRYMLLCKVMIGQGDLLDTVLSGKSAKLYPLSSLWIDGFKAVAEAVKSSSLLEFKAALDAHHIQDPVINQHLQSLYDSLLEQNLVKIIAPYQRVALSVLAGQVQLPVNVVERKLCQMILDKTISAVIDQGDGGYLVRVEKVEHDPLYSNALKLIHSLDFVVEGLYTKAKSLQ